MDLEIEIIFGEMQGIIFHTDYAIEYFEYGHGPKIMFAFHGFNNHALDFKKLGEILAEDYKVIAFNIFFHGESHAQHNLVEKGFQNEDLKNLFSEMSSKFPAEKYTLLGYSLGGRIVLKILEILPEKMEDIILIAPDGIRISLFYKFLTQTLFGKYLLKRVVKKPSLFFLLADWIKKIGLVSEKKYHFAKGNFDSNSKREKVYLVWMILRKIVSRKADLKNIIQKFNIPINLFFGKYDTIIPASIGLNFRKGMEKYISLDVLETGHKMINDKTLLDIAQKFKAKKKRCR